MSEVWRKHIVECSKCGNETIFKTTMPGLTDEDILEALKEADPIAQRLPPVFRVFAHAIERRIFERKTKGEQE